MDTKLTLKLDEFVIEQAKTYAKSKNISLSQLIETYLNFIVNPKDEHEETTPLVKSLSGVIKLPKNYDTDKNYKSHILNKYLK